MADPIETLKLIENEKVRDFLKKSYNDMKSLWDDARFQNYMIFLMQMSEMFSPKFRGNSQDAFYLGAAYMGHLIYNGLNEVRPDLVGNVNSILYQFEEKRKLREGVENDSAE